MAIQNNFPALKPTLLLDFANVQALDPRVSFARASTATYYGTQTAKAEENLLLRSQEFEVTGSWPQNGVSVIANTTAAPDGTTTSDSLFEILSTGAHRVRQSAAAGSYTVSVFVKPNGRDFFAIASDDGATAFAVFNLSTGAVGTTGGAVSNAAITAAPNGFYRVSVTLTVTALGPYFHIRDADSAPASYAGDNTKGVFLWGAQLEQRSAVTAYTPTTTQPITNYIPVLESAASGVARFDHNPNTFESLGLLIEESRTNLVLRSEELDNASWSKTNVTIIQNTVVAPDGALAGDLVQENTASSTHSPTQTVTFSAGATLCMSVYVKQQETGSARHLRLQMGNTNGFRAYFDLTNGTVATQAAGFGTGTAVTDSGSITPVGDGWYRCSVAGTCGPSDTTGSFILFMQDTPTGGASYTGNGYSGIYIWGAQLEAGAFPTSYIPTVASQVTRSADAASMTGANFSSWYNQAEGAFFVETEMYPVQAAFFRFLLSANSGSGSGGTNRVDFTIPSNSSNMRFTTVSGGVSNTILQASITLGSTFKAAGSYKTNDIGVSFNGASALTTTTGFAPADVNRLYIGSVVDTGVGSAQSTRIKKLAYYPIRVTNAQLQSLTG